MCRAEKYYGLFQTVSNRADTHCRLSLFFIFPTAHFFKFNFSQPHIWHIYNCPNIQSQRIGKSKIAKSPTAPNDIYAESNHFLRILTAITSNFNWKNYQTYQTLTNHGRSWLTGEKERHFAFCYCWNKVWLRYQSREQSQKKIRQTAFWKSECWTGSKRD